MIVSVLRHKTAYTVDVRIMVTSGVEVGTQLEKAFWGW